MTPASPKEAKPLTPDKAVDDMIDMAKRLPAHDRDGLTARLAHRCVAIEAERDALRAQVTGLLRQIRWLNEDADIEVQP